MIARAARPARRLLHDEACAFDDVRAAAVVGVRDGARVRPELLHERHERRLLVVARGRGALDAGLRRPPRGRERSDRRRDPREGGRRRRKLWVVRHRRHQALRE
jgi:hypothetical protein